MNLSVYDEIVVSESFQVGLSLPSPISDSVTVSETIFITLPSLTQTGIGIVSGTTYQLLFDAVITTGVLKVYQGTQLLYRSDVVFVGIFNTLYDRVFVTENIALVRFNNIQPFESATITENIALSLSFAPNVFDSVTITENTSLTVV